MIEFYPEIRFVHITAVLASGSLFLVRGAVLFAGGRWVLSSPVRRLSYAIDTVLLTAAIMLTVIINQYPFVDAWLTVKVMLLVVYVVLGVVAFWKGPTQTVRIACWVMALVVYAFIYSVARAHDPAGVFSGFGT